MSATRPFLFGDDLGSPAQARRVAEDRARSAEREAVAAADREGYARGLAAGRAEAEAETPRRQADALQRATGALTGLLAQIDRRAAGIETEALVFFDTLARRLCAEVAVAEPLAGIREAALETFRHLRGVPHLVARVHAGVVEGVEPLLRGVAREAGYEGRLIVLGSDEVPPGDARLEWADGGIVLDRAAFEAAIEAALSAARIPPSHPAEALP